MQEVKVQLIVGENDTDVAGRGFFEWLAKYNQDEERNIRQGSGSLTSVSLGRRQMIELVQNDLVSCGVETQLVVVPGVGHEASDVIPWVCKFWETFISR